MNNKPAERQQDDNQQELYSRATDFDVTKYGKEGESLTRQEMKDDADVNLMLSRYGVTGTGRQPVFGEVDFNLDLQTAMHAIRDAQDAYARVPAELKAKYPTWQALLNALDSGTLVLDMSPADAEIKKAETPPADLNTGTTT